MSMVSSVSAFSMGLPQLLSCSFPPSPAEVDGSTYVWVDLWNPNGVTCSGLTGCDGKLVWWRTDSIFTFPPTPPAQTQVDSNEECLRMRMTNGRLYGRDCDDDIGTGTLCQLDCTNGEKALYRSVETLPIIIAISLIV